MSYTRQNNFSGQFFPALNAGLRFNGVDQYVDLGSPTKLNFTTAFTVSYFIKINTIPATNASFHVGRHSDTTNRSWFIGQPNSGAITFSINTTGLIGSNNTNVSSSSLVEERWYHVAGVYSPSTYLRIYINGVLDNENTTSIPASFFSGTNTTKIGERSEVLGVFMDADMAYLQMFDSALSSEQIYQIATTGGLIPQSAHESCILNMPFQQDKYYKELTGGGGSLYPITGITQASGDKIAFDLSTQFNYAKTTAIGATHGQMPTALWTDNELYVADGNNSTSLINLYGKNPAYRRVARSYDGVGDYDTVNSFNVPSSLSPFTEIYSFDYVNDGLVQCLSSEFTTANTEQGKAVLITSTGVLRIFLKPAALLGVTDLVFDCDTPLKEGKNIVQIFYTGNEDVNSFNIYINRVLSQKTLIRDNLQSYTSAVRNSYLGVNNTLENFFNGELKTLQRLNADYSANQAFIDYVNANESAEGFAGVTFLLNVKANETGNLTDYSPVPYSITGTRSVADDVLIGQGANVDFNSGIPVPRQGLLLADMDSDYIALDTTNIEQQTGSFSIYLTVKLGTQTFVSALNAYVELFQIGTNAQGYISFIRKNAQVNYPVTSARIVAFNSLTTGFPNTNATFTEDDNNSDFNYYITFALSYNSDTQLGRTYFNGGIVKQTVTTGIDWNTVSAHNIGHPSSLNTLTTDGAKNVNVINYGYWKRALQPAEIAYLHNNGVPQTPAKILAETGTNMQDDMVIWHNFNEGDIFDSGGVKLKNWGSGTDATINGFANAAAARLALTDINELR